MKSQNVKPNISSVQSDTLMHQHNIYLLHLSHWLLVITVQIHVGHTNAGCFHLYEHVRIRCNCRPEEMIFLLLCNPLETLIV